MWRNYVKAIRILGALVAVVWGPLLWQTWKLHLFLLRLARRRLLPDRVYRMACAAGVAVILLMPVMIPAQSPSQSEFERLKTQVENQHDRLGRAERHLDDMQRDVNSIKLDVAGSLPEIRTDINGLKWIGGIVGGIFAACLPVAFKAGRWYQKTEHISGEHTPVKAR